MYPIFPNLLAMLTLSIGTLPVPASIEGRSGGFGTLGQDANLTVYYWNDLGTQCIPSIPTASVSLSWGVNCLTPGGTQSFSLSRALSDTEHLDWSNNAAPDPPGAHRGRSESVLHGCENFVRSTDLNVIGQTLGGGCLRSIRCQCNGKIVHPESVYEIH